MTNGTKLNTFRTVAEMQYDLEIVVVLALSFQKLYEFLLISATHKTEAEDLLFKFEFKNFNLSKAGKYI